MAADFFVYGQQVVRVPPASSQAESGELSCLFAGLVLEVKV